MPSKYNNCKVGTICRLNHDFIDEVKDTEEERNGWKENNYYHQDSIFKAKYGH